MKSFAGNKITCENGARKILHCLAHCTELILHDTITVLELLSFSLALCQTLYGIADTYQHVDLFGNIQKDFI